MKNKTWNFFDREGCSICGWPTATAEPIEIDPSGAVACRSCRWWANSEGRKAAEGALTRGLCREVDRMIDAALAWADGD